MFLGILIILIIKEDTTKSTCFITMLNDKVSVSPCLKFFVVFGVMFVTDLLVSSVEMFHILFIDIRRCDVGSSTEPPNSTVRFKITVVEVHGRAMRVLGVHDGGKSAGKEGDTFTGCHTLGTVDTTFGSSLKSFLRHGTVDNGQVDTGLLKYLSTGKDTRHTTTTIGTDPSVFLKGSFTINIGNGLGNGDLCFTAHFFESGTHGIVSLRTITLTDK
mmetsp:Transcript_15488/g.18654  ORF Transcript_15488/g.18654 Transcript_15488/m.18654 type:complete len:216 (+) Transcript_15488:974-1621(+)